MVGWARRWWRRSRSFEEWRAASGREIPFLDTPWAVRISVTWHTPLRLPLPMTHLHERFDPDELPDEAAIYLFARRFGLRMEVLYVGKATSLRKRIKQQLNNLKLMQAIDRAAIGPRMLIYGTLNCRPGQRIETVLEVVERALIDHYTEAGDQLINKMGTKLPVDIIEFDGNLLARRRSGRELRVPKRRGRAAEIA